jgi:peptidylprolyl isomerase
VTRVLVLALVLTGTLTACGASSGTPAPAGRTPTPTPAATETASCTPSGTGTTDLTKKPVVARSSAPAPAETTTVDIVCGTGAEAKNGSSVKVRYVGLLYQDGSEFDSSWSRAATDTLSFTVGSGVIPGFSKGTEGMRVGGRREVIIPSKDGYGENGTGPIPGGAALVFVIDLVKVG